MQVWTRFNRESTIEFSDNRFNGISIMEEVIFLKVVDKV